MVLQTSSLTMLETLIESYRLECKIQAKSPKTISIYTTALSILHKFLQQYGLTTDVSEIGVKELGHFILYLQQAKAFREHPYAKPQQKGLTGHTINCYLRAIRAFWSWLLFEEMIDGNPFDKVRVPKPPKRVIVPFTDEQLRALLATIDTHSSSGFRNWTIIIMLLDTGLRVSELCNLKLEDTNINERSLKVYGKGAKERIVPIGGTVQRAIAKYIKRYRPEPVNQTSAHLFLTSVGEALTANRVEVIIKQYAQKAGIEGVRCSPHTFRHTFAISYLRNGGDVFTLQRILGHESLDMVRTYVNVATSDLQAAHQRYSPVDNLRLKAARNNALNPTAKG